DPAIATRLLPLASCRGCGCCCASSTTLPSRRRTLRSKQRYIVAIVFTNKLHDLDDAGTGIGVVSARLSPLTCRLLRIFVNDFVKETRRAGTCEALDGVKAFAGFIDAADRMSAVIGNRVDDQCVAVPTGNRIAHPCGIRVDTVRCIYWNDAKRSGILIEDQEVVLVLDDLKGIRHAKRRVGRKREAIGGSARWIDGR